MPERPGESNTRFRRRKMPGNRVVSISYAQTAVVRLLLRRIQHGLDQNAVHDTLFTGDAVGNEL